MKITTIVVAILAIVFGATLIGRAQSNGEAAVKILPTAQAGVYKIVYAYNTDQPVEVKFYNEDRLISSDKIKGDFKNGFSKRYDLNEITSSFWIEVRSADISVIYKMVESRGRQAFVPLLETTTYNHLVAANN